MLRDTSREKLYTEGIDFNESNSLKKSKCGLIREDFEVVRFFDCVEITNGQVDPKLDIYSGMYQIGSERIEPNTGAITELKTAQELKIISGNFLFTEEDIIYSKIRPYFKKVANPNFTGLCSADIYPLRPKNNLISKEFLFYYLLTEKFTRRLLRFQNRTGMPKVNRDELGSMYIPIPPPGEEQKIVNFLKEIDQVYFSAVKKCNKSKRLLNSIINEVF
jgi:type I restriction enzyme S subunit